MKQISLLFLLAFMLISCEEKESSTLFALVNDDEWTATDVNFSIEDSTLIIYGENDNLGDIIALTLKKFHGIGAIDLNRESTAIYRDAEGDVCIICETPTVYTAYSGQVEITHYDSASIRGTFNFYAGSSTTDDNVTISLGQFNLLRD